MARERRQRVLSAIANSDGTSPVTEHLCLAAVDLAGVTGAAISLMSGADTEATVWATDGIRNVEELQYTLGEGPGIDAHHTGNSVLVPDLRQVTAWPAFAPSAMEAGVTATFCFPLQIGAAGIGTINLYRDEAGPLDRDQLADSVMLADVATQVVLGLQAESPPEELHQLLSQRPDWHWPVHQATGMVAVQLHVELPEALLRLRAHAYANDRRLGDVAADVVARRLRLEADA